MKYLNKLCVEHVSFLCLCHETCPKMLHVEVVGRGWKAGASAFADYTPQESCIFFSNLAFVDLCFGCKDSGLILSLILCVRLWPLTDGEELAQLKGWKGMAPRGGSKGHLRRGKGVRFVGSSQNVGASPEERGISRLFYTFSGVAVCMLGNLTQRYNK